MQVLVTKTLHDLFITVSDQLLGVTLGMCIVWSLVWPYKTVS